MIQISLMVMAVAPMVARALIWWGAPDETDFRPEDVEDIEDRFSRVLAEFCHLAR